MMNQLGAENAALRLVLWKSKRIQEVVQLCELVSMWHTHIAHKTHSQKGWVELPKHIPVAIPLSCQKIEECYH